MSQPFFKPDVHRISNFDPLYSENDSAVVNLRNRSWIRLVINVINVTANASEAPLGKERPILPLLTGFQDDTQFRHSDRKGLERHAVLSACRWILAGNAPVTLSTIVGVRSIEPPDLHSTRAALIEIYI